MLTSTEQARKKAVKAPGSGKTWSYNELVDYLDSMRPLEYGEQALARMRQLDALFDNVSSKIDIVLVGGTNGKSSTIHFASKLLREEGFSVGAAYSTHFLNYNERVAVNFQTIQNKAFTEIVGEVVQAAEEHDIKATAFEIMTMSSVLHFFRDRVDVALIEVGYGGKLDATNIFNPKIAAVTRVAHDQRGLLGDDLDALAFEMTEIAKKDSWCISADQSKIRLQKIKNVVEPRGVKWAMPIRKLTQLPYIFEQLYGRSASLGERIAQLYVEDVKGKFSPFLRGNLLATQQGQRGRPTLEAKRQAELNPIKTLKGFWQEQFDLLKGRFEVLETEKPTILLDNACNVDALDNLFLGVRLLHYQKSLKGLAIVLGVSKAMDAMETVKLLRYLLKKVSGSVFFMPLPDKDIESHDPEALAALAKDLNLKAQGFSSFEKAFAKAKDSVDERDGLVCVTGSAGMVSEYWKHRGIKKFV